MSNQDIQNLKSKINLVDLISSYVEIKKSGTNYKGVCPFHNEKSPSFMVNEKLQIFKCFGCGESGDLFSFVQKIEGLDFHQTMKFLSEKYGIPIEDSANKYQSDQGLRLRKIEEINHLTQEYYTYLLNSHSSGKRALDYLQNQRKLTMSTISEFKLGYAPNGWNNLTHFLKKKGYTEQELLEAGVVQKNSRDGIYDKFRGRVIFPYFSLDQKCIGFMGRTISNDSVKYLNSPETAVFKKSEFLYGLHKTKLAIKKEGAILVEGNMDFLKPYQYGFKNLVATSGTALTNQQLQIIKRYTDKLYFCFDSDAAGVDAILRGVEIADKLEFDLKVIKIKAPYKDLDEYFDHEGLDITSLTQNAIDIYDFFLQHLYSKFNKKTASGKNHILKEFQKFYNKIQNKITKAHYLKKIAENLELSEELAGQSLSEPFQTDSQPTSVKSNEQTNTSPIAQPISSKEGLFWSILLNSSIDIIKPIMLEFNLKYFNNQQSKELYQALLGYLQQLGAQKFDISSFADTLPGDLKVFCLEKMMVDTGVNTLDSKQVSEELTKLLRFFKVDSIKKEIKFLHYQLKEAENENNLEKVNSYTLEINKLSKLLNV